MITPDELRASGERLTHNHRHDVLQLAAMHMTCSHLLKATGADSDATGRMMLDVLHDCVAARRRELGVDVSGLSAAETDVRRASDVLDYLDALPTWP